MKHNKKRNTAFLYEALVKELTKASLRSDKSGQSIISSILKEHFNTNSILGKELELYQTIVSTSEVEADTAERILSEVKRVYHTLSPKEIYDEQSEVIGKVNKDLTKDIFRNFISNYKSLATINQMFSDKTPINKRIMLEKAVIEKMIMPKTKQQHMKPIDNITYKMFVNKFNEKYGDTLNENQKILLSRYVTLSPETAVEFKVYINEEISRLKSSIVNLQNKKEVLLDESLSNKNKQILDILESFKQQSINDNMIKTILKVQSLESEIE
tara:strand:+ start:247 stop:1056 length:810 start_codon:yes stop_codon:yes gene_type:complete